MNTAKLPDSTGCRPTHADTATYAPQSNLAMVWKMFTRTLFVIIRSVIWAATFLFSTPEPLGWLRGVVVERGADWELCSYYLLKDLEQFLYYLIYIFIWSLPFVKIRKLWNTLRIDVLSILAALLLNTILYILYIQYFTSTL